MNAAPIIFLATHAAAGGVRELWADLAAGFADAGYPVRLLALFPPAERTPQAAWDKVCEARPSGFLGGLGVLRALVRLLRKERPAMLFSAMPAANALAPLACRIANVGTRVCISHHTPADGHAGVMSLIDSFSGSLECTRSVITVSEAVARSLSHKPARYLGKHKTIRNALSPSVETRLTALCASRTCKPGQGPRVVALGRLAEEKNYPVLLRAATHLAEVDIVIVGAGPLGEHLRKMASRLGVADRVRFLGQLQRETAIEMLASADIFAQPSVFEGHSLALLEAARLGVPLVVSDAPSQVEAVTRSDGVRCGIVVERDDDRGLAGAFRALAADPAYHQAWSSAASQLADQASFKDMLASYMSLVKP